MNVQRSRSKHTQRALTLLSRKRRPDELFSSSPSAPSVSQASGVLMVGIGIWMRVQLRDYVNLTEEGSGAALLALASLGAVLTLAATLACCCTARGHPALLYLVSEVRYKRGSQVKSILEPRITSRESR